MRDPTGGALAGATVQVLLALEGRTWPLGRGRSGADGSFTLEALPEGSYWVVASAPGRARSVVPLRLRAESEPLALTLAEGGTITGMLTTRRDGASAPLERTVLRALREGDPTEPPVLARTDDAGAFTLEGLSRGTWRIEVDPPGFETLRRVGVPMGARGLSLVLRALASLEGIVRNARGEGERGARVLLSGSGVWPAREVPVLPDGRFAVSGLPAGVYELRASYLDDVAEPLAPLDLEPGEHRQVALTVLPGATLTGVVADARTGRPVPGARLVLSEEALSTAPRALTADDTGGFTVRGLLRRAHQLSARAPGYAARTGVTVTPGEAPARVELSLAGALDGRVVDGHGEPVAGAQVELSVRDPEGQVSLLSGAAVAFTDALFAAQVRGPSALVPAGELGVTRGRVPLVPLVPVPAGILAEHQAPGFATDGDGRFHLPEVPPGVVQLVVSHPLYVRALSEERVLQPGQTAELTVTVHTGGTLDGRVLTARGFPMAGAQVELRTEREPFPRRFFAERDGTFRVPSVLGHATLVAWLGGRVAARAEVDVADDATVPVNLVVPGALRHIEGRVVDARGFPVPSASITLTALDSAALGAAITLTADDGTFDTALGGAGAISVGVRHPDHAPRNLRVEDPSGSLRIELDDGGGFSLEVVSDGCATGRGRLEARTPCGPVSAELDAGETVRLERLCVGRVTVRVTLPGCLVGERVGAVPAGRVATLERLEVRAGGGAEGDVVDARGEPVQGARVQRADAPVEAPDGVLTAREGRFLAASLPEGDVALVATHPALGRSAPTVVRVLRGTVARGVRLRFATDLASATLALEASALELVETRLGVLVRAVREDTPMAAAGVREGDRVVSVNAVAVTTAAQAERLLRLSRGDQTVLELERDGARRAVRWAR